MAGGSIDPHATNPNPSGPACMTSVLPRQSANLNTASGDFLWIADVFPDLGGRGVNQKLCWDHFDKSDASAGLSRWRESSASEANRELHASTLFSGLAFRHWMRCCPRRRTRIRLAKRRTRKCFMMAQRLILNRSAIRLTGKSCSASRSRICLRVGSAMALRTGPRPAMLNLQPECATIRLNAKPRLLDFVIYGYATAQDACPLQQNCFRNSKHLP